MNHSLTKKLMHIKIVENNTIKWNQLTEEEVGSFFIKNRTFDKMERVGYEETIPV